MEIVHIGLHVQRNLQDWCRNKILIRVCWKLILFVIDHNNNYWNDIREIYIIRGYIWYRTYATKNAIFSIILWNLISIICCFFVFIFWWRSFSIIIKALLIQRQRKCFGRGRERTWKTGFRAIRVINCITAMLYIVLDKLKVDTGRTVVTN